MDARRLACIDAASRARFSSMGGPPAMKPRLTSEEREPWNLHCNTPQYGAGLVN